MKDVFNKLYPVSDEVLDDYLSNWKSFKLAKNTIMTWEGDTEKYMYFVLKGIQKSYYSYGSKQHVIAFAYAPSFSGIPESFFTQQPSKYFLETVTDCEFIRISFKNHQKMMQKHRDIETLFRKATELLLVGVLERQHELLAFDMETRFKVFVKRSPHLLQMVSQKDIASYLRINATNFSKLINSIKI